MLPLHLQVVEAGDHLLDGGFVDMDVLDGRLRAMGDQFRCREFRRVEGRSSGGPYVPDGDPDNLERGLRGGEVDVLSRRCGRERRARRLAETSIGQQAALADDDDALASRTRHRACLGSLSRRAAPFRD